MFKIDVKNEFIFEIVINGDNKIFPGQSGTSGVVGERQVLEIPFIGVLLAIYLGEEKLPGYDIPGSSGVLLRYSGHALYYRYDGEGQINLHVDHIGNLKLTTGQGTALAIRLDEFVHAGQAT